MEQENTKRENVCDIEMISKCLDDQALIFESVRNQRNQMYLEKKQEQPLIDQHHVEIQTQHVGKKNIKFGAALPQVTAVRWACAYASIELFKLNSNNCNASKLRAF